MTTPFWIENVMYLFDCQEGFFPHAKMNFECQLNALSRLIFILFFILLFLKFPFDLHFLTISLLVMILIYYTFQWYTKPNVKEPYGKVESVLVPPPTVEWNSANSSFIFSPSITTRTNCPTGNDPQCPLTIPIEHSDNLQWVDSQSRAWCTPSAYPSISNTYSINQQLVGPPNPRTLVRPIIPNPIYDFETWLPNDFVVPQGINDQKRQELFQNGYISLPCDSFSYPNTNDRRSPINSDIRENYSNEYSVPNPMNYNQSNYNIPSPTIDISCGYSPTNLSYDLPINYQSTSCQKTTDMKEYNRNLFSIPIQPNIYTSSEVNQPYASMYNLGISETNPFPPMIPSYNPKTNQLNMKEYAPSQVQPRNLPPYQSEHFGRPLRNEIYDPRLTGYGTSYRSYVEPMTGQPRFYYDDIDQQTQPNYITRNNLDIYGFASQIGPLQESTLEGNRLRETANQNYTDNQLLFRTELQQRLLHKNNSREWQQRQAPITTQTTFSRNGGTMTGFR